MRRRDFIKTIAGSAAAWPLAARAQQSGGRRIGALIGYAESDPQAQSRFAGFKQELAALGDGFMFVHRKAVIELTARHKVPAIYYFREAAIEGGLISYGVNNADLFRSAAPYVDRILRGARPADLPAQGPTKYELFVNSKTAEALGLTIPTSLLVAAEEVIE